MMLGERVFLSGASQLTQEMKVSSHDAGRMDGVFEVNRHGQVKPGNENDLSCQLFLEAVTLSEALRNLDRHCPGGHRHATLRAAQPRRGRGRAASM